MKKLNIKINYLYNSAFKIETEKQVFIFDYYLDSVETGEKNSLNGAIGEEDLKTNKEILVFCTHKHEDHYNDVIFSWAKVNPNIKYILSSDIEINSEELSIHKLSPYEKINFQDVYIKAYGSTDIGISILVRTNDLSIFHAGDLNWWHWYDESEESNAKQEKDFKEEVEKIKKQQIDIAFFPVDARLKDSYNLGVKYFCSKIKPNILIPMHFREDYYILKEFKRNNTFDYTEVIEITKRGEIIKF